MSTEVGSLNASLTLDLSDFNAGIDEAAAAARELASMLSSLSFGGIFSTVAREAAEAAEQVRQLSAAVQSFQAEMSSESSAQMFASMKTYTAELMAEMGQVQSNTSGATNAAQQLSAALENAASRARDASQATAAMGNLNPTGTPIDLSGVQGQMRDIAWNARQMAEALQQIGYVDLDTGELVNPGTVAAIGAVDEATKSWAATMQDIRRIWYEIDSCARTAAAVMGLSRQQAGATVPHIKNVRKEIMKGNSALRTTHGYWTNIKGIISGIVVSQAFYQMLGVMEQLVRGAVEFSQAIQDASVSMEYLMRDTNVSSGAFINAMKDISLSSPLDTTDLLAASRQMMAMGFSAEATVPAIQILTDTAAVFSNTAGDMNDQIQHITLALGQMLASGKVSAQELRQLYNAGLPIYDLLADGLGITKEMAKNIGHYDVEPAAAVFAILTQLQERYAGASKDLARTMSGSLEVISEALQQLLAYAWDPAFQALTGQLNKIADYLIALVKITQAYGIGGLFQAIFPPSSWKTIRLCLAGLQQIGAALGALFRIVGSVFGEAIHIASTIGSVVLPILGTIAQAIMYVVQAIFVAVPGLKTLAAALVLLFVGLQVAAVLKRLAGAIALLTGASAAAKSIVTLFNTFSRLFKGSTAVTVAVLAIAAAFLALIASSEKAKAALANFFGGIGNAVNDFAESLNWGMDADDIAVPEFKMPETQDFSEGLKDLTSGFEDLADAEDDAAGKAKKASKNLQSFDEVYQITTPEEDDGGLGNTLDDMLDKLGGLGNLDYSDMFDWTGDWATDWANLAGGLDIGLGGLSDSLGSVSDMISEFWSKLTGGGDFTDTLAIFDVLSGILALLGNTKWAGALQVAEGIAKIAEALRQISEEGINFDNIMLLADGLGDLCIGIGMLTGNIKLTGVGLMIQGLSEVCAALKDIVVSGIDMEGILNVIEGLGKIAAGLGLLTGNKKLASVGLIVTGLTSIISELAANWDAIRQGDWSGVDKVALIVGGLEILGGLVVALQSFAQIKSASDTAKAVKALTDTATTVQQMDDTMTGSGKTGGGVGLNTSLVNFAKNMGLIIAIVAEVAVAAALFVAAIWLLGELLQQVADAWAPVLANGDTVVTAVVTGTAILVAVGIACKLLGDQGATLITNLGLGLAALAEIGIAATLFVAEVWLIGEMLQQVVDAWEPVLASGDAAPTAVTLGTAILAAVGVACGLLGEAAKSLITQMALGVAILAEISVAADLFIAEIWAIGELLGQVVEAWQPVLDNGDTAATAVATGAAILVVIGAATAALGAAGISLMGYIALGMVMLIELGAAALLFLAEIWAIGEILGQIVDAWDPVLKNGDTVAAAIGLGTALLVAIGVVCAALGVATVASYGLLPLAIGLGTAILLEMGAAALLFIAEIWAIGEALGQVLEAWQPILNEGDAVAKAISTGTTLLIAVGAATAALGVATVASAGLLPVAIALGTAILVELAVAVIALVESMSDVAESLINDLAPVLKEINSELPSLKDNMHNFVEYMSDFATEVQSYTSSMGSMTWSSIVQGFLALFASNPLEDLADDVQNTYEDVKALNEKLTPAVDELQKCVELLTSYNAFMNRLQILTSEGGNIVLQTGMLTNLKEVGEALVLGLIEGIESTKPQALATVQSLGTDITAQMHATLTANFSAANFVQYGTNVVAGIKQGVTTEMSSMSVFLTSGVNSPMASWMNTNFAPTQYTKYGTNTITGLKQGITTGMSSMSSHLTSTVINPVNNNLTQGFNSANFTKYGNNTITGLKQGVTTSAASLPTFVTSTVVNPVKNTLNIGTASSQYIQYGSNPILGMQRGVQNSAPSLVNGINTNVVIPVKNAVSNGLSPATFEGFGRNIMQGLLNGISSMASAINDRVRSICDGIKARIQSALDIHSPSKFTEWCAEMLMLGLSGGLDDNAREAIMTAGEISKDLTAALTPETVDMSNSLRGASDAQGASLDALTMWSSTFVGTVDNMLKSIIALFEDFSSRISAVELNMQNISLPDIPATIGASIAPIAAAEQPVQSQQPTTGTPAASEVLAHLDDDSIIRLSVATAERLYEYLAPMLADMSAEDQQATIAYVGTLIADDRGLKQLERKLKVIRASEERRKS